MPDAGDTFPGMTLPLQHPTPSPSAETRDSVPAPAHRASGALLRSPWPGERVFSGSDGSSKVLATPAWKVVLSPGMSVQPCHPSRGLARSPAGTVALSDQNQVPQS